MNELYQIALDDTLPLEERYAAVKLMLHQRKVDPRNRLKLMEKAARQRKYNAARKDYRGYPA